MDARLERLGIGRDNPGQDDQDDVCSMKLTRLMEVEIVRSHGKKYYWLVGSLLSPRELFPVSIDFHTIYLHDSQIFETFQNQCDRHAIRPKGGFKRLSTSIARVQKIKGSAVKVTWSD